MHLVKGGRGSFPACWGLANVVIMPKGSPSSDVEDYIPDSITPLLSKAYENIVAEKCNNFLESSSLLPASQFSYRRDLGTCDALLTLSRHLKFTLNWGMEGRLAQLDFPGAFHRVSHCGLLYKLKSIARGLFLPIVPEFKVSMVSAFCMVRSVRQLM